MKYEIPSLLRLPSAADAYIYIYTYIYIAWVGIGVLIAKASGRELKLKECRTLDQKR